MTQERDPEFDRLLQYLAASRGFDFTAYKQSSLMRRTRTRMETLHVGSFGEYLDRLEADPGEFGRLFDTLLINVTSFFRDREAWTYLQQEVVPAILEARGPEDPIRVWSAGCASGEEPFTLAMVFAEVLGIEETIRRLKIYATDVDENVLAIGRHAAYNESALEDVPGDLRSRYFEALDSRYIFRPDLRRIVIFGRHDLLQDSPISRLDLLSCRNTLMYFTPESQQRVLRTFFFALRDGGYLFLGKAETMLTNSDAVDSIESRFRISRKRPSGPREHPLPGQNNGGRDEAAEPPDVDVRLHRSLLEADPAAVLVVGAGGLLALANHQAREIFHLSALDLGRPLQDLQLSYRPVELRSLIERVYEERRAVSADDVVLATPGGERRWHSVDLVPLFDGRELLGARIAFSDVTDRKQLQQDVERSKSELNTAYEELQSANEELETTNEELQSTIEELETTNEEMQSSNEELETMNEELQSTNEELQTLNRELQQQSDALDNTNEFLESVLRSLLSAVIVIDRDMKVEVWNQAAQEQWGLRYNEVAGRHLPSLDIGLPVDQLVQAIRQALTEPSESHQLNVEAVNRRGRNVDCTVVVTARRRKGDDVMGAIIVVDSRLRDG